MSTRTERDQARIRCLVATISSLHCEIARVVQAGEDPEQLDAYAQANFEKGEDEEGALCGLSMEDLVDMLGPIAVMEKLVSIGHSAEMILSVIESGDRAGARDSVDPGMWRDVLLYLEAITQDRPAETFDAQA